MKMTVPKPLRCAIYTTEHNLDLGFNWRDASVKPVKPTCCRSTLTMVGCLAPCSRVEPCSSWLLES